MNESNQHEPVSSPTPPTPPPFPLQPEINWDSSGQTQADQPGQSGQAEPSGHTGQARKDGLSPCLPVWEQSGVSWLSAFCKTTWQVLFRPYITFKQISYPGASSLIAYALPWVVLLVAFDLLYGNLAGKTVFTVSLFLKNLAASCLIFVLSMLILHLALKVVRADKNGLKATFRANMYLCCSYFWCIIPWVGPLLAVVWCCAIIFSVLAASQQVSRMRILGALLVYLGILFLILLVITMIIGMAAISHMLNTMLQGAQSPFPW